jgi:hypothetical protein
MEDDNNSSKGLRQASFWFGKGASSTGGKVTLRQTSDDSHEKETFSSLQHLEDTAVHIIFVVDSTGSMGNFINSMPDTLTQVYSILAVLFGTSAEVSIVEYSDYSDGEKNLLRKCVGKSREQTLQFVNGLKAGGGGDVPEASKTAMAAVLKIIRQSAISSSQTLVFHYTDAVCHHPTNFATKGLTCNGARERKLLTTSSKCNVPTPLEKAGITGWKSTAIATFNNPGFDWVSICSTFHSEEIRVYSFTPREYHLVHQSWPFLAMLGDVACLENTLPKTISKLTINVILQLMGQEIVDDDTENESSCSLAFYPSRPMLKRMNGNDDKEKEGEGEGEENGGEQKQHQHQHSSTVVTNENTKWLVPLPHLVEHGVIPHCSISQLLSSSNSSKTSPASISPCLAPPWSVTCNYRTPTLPRGIHHEPGELHEFVGCGQDVNFLSGYWYSYEKNEENGRQDQYLCNDCHEQLLIRIYDSINDNQTNMNGETKVGVTATTTTTTATIPMKEINNHIKNFHTKHQLIECTPETLTVNQPRLMYTKTKKYESVPFMKRDLSLLPDQFKYNETFKALVFNTMHLLMVPNNVMSLTSNSVIGKYCSCCYYTILLLTYTN